MKLLEIRVGGTQQPSHYAEVLESKGGSWPEKEHCSAYDKHIVSEVHVTTTHGLAGNEIGHPIHLEYGAYRHALVCNELVWQDFEERIPQSSSRMTRGCFGENFVVNDPSLHPSVVCVGDEFKVGTAKFRVTGPRQPCPKVNAYLNLQGITELGRKTAWLGYFVQVIADGICQIGDSFELLHRPYPGVTMTRISRGLWGDAEDQDHSEEFLQLLSSIECLIPRHFRDTAAQRLQRLQDKKGEIA